MRIISLLLLIFAISSCVNMATLSQQSFVDDRPTVTFEISGYKPERLRLYIDNLSYGSLKQYESDSTKLALLAGRHLIEIYDNNVLVYSRNQFFAESTTSIIKVHK